MTNVEVSVGLYCQEITSNVNETLSNLHKNGYDVMVTAVAVVIPLIFGSFDDKLHPKRNGQTVQSARHRIITSITITDIECDSSDQSVRRSSEAELLRQLSYADRFGTPSLIPLQCKDTYNLARIISRHTFKSNKFN